MFPRSVTFKSDDEVYTLGSRVVTRVVTSGVEMTLGGLVKYISEEHESSEVELLVAKDSDIRIRKTKNIMYLKDISTPPDSLEYSLLEFRRAAFERAALLSSTGYTSVYSYNRDNEPKLPRVILIIASLHEDSFSMHSKSILEFPEEFSEIGFNVVIITNQDAADKALTPVQKKFVNDITLPSSNELGISVGSAIVFKNTSSSIDSEKLLGIVHSINENNVIVWVNGISMEIDLSDILSVIGKNNFTTKLIKGLGKSKGFE